MGIKKNRRPTIAPDDQGKFKDVAGGGTDYSTSEQDTGTKWLDGKTIYKQTFVKASVAAGSTATSITHNIAGLSQVVAHESTVKRSNGEWLPMPFAHIIDTFEISLLVSPTIIEMTPGTSWNGVGNEALSDMTVTLYYTKA